MHTHTYIWRAFQNVKTYTIMNIIMQYVIHKARFIYIQRIYLLYNYGMHPFRYKKSVGGYLRFLP